MEYPKKNGLASKNMANLGKYLAYIYAIFLVLGAIGAGNTFQVSQSLAVAQEQIVLFQDYPYLFGLILASITGLVIIGGIKRIECGRGYRSIYGRFYILNWVFGGSYIVPTFGLRDLIGLAFWLFKFF